MALAMQIEVPRCFFLSLADDASLLNSDTDTSNDQTQNYTNTSNTVARKRKKKRGLRGGFFIVGVRRLTKHSDINDQTQTDTNTSNSS